MFTALALVLMLQGASPTSNEAIAKVFSHVGGEIWEISITSEQLAAAPLWDEAVAALPYAP